jgi:hypothetical protein
MATIAGNTKYGEGHQVILKDYKDLSSLAKKAFMDSKYIPGKSVFSITVSPNNKKKVFNVIELPTGPGSVYLLDDKRKVVLVIGTNNAINNSFNHYTANSKSDTNILTEVRENISLWMMESIIEHNKILSEDEIISKLGDMKKYYSTTFYESSVKQSQALKKEITTKGYIYERQHENLTKSLYDKGRKLSKKSNDNWNPADVWMIKRGYDINKLVEIDNLEELNTEIAIAYKKKEVIPVSLKQVTTPKGKFAVVDPSTQMTQKLDYDFSFEKVDFSGQSYTGKSFANFQIETKSGFAVRGGFKSSGASLNVSLEGKWVGAGYQLGAVDAKTYPVHCKEKYGYVLRNGVNVSKSEHELAKKELKEIFQKYPRVSHTLKTYDDAMTLFLSSDDFTKDRFSNIVSYLYSFLIAPLKVKSGFDDNMKYCYFSAKKITSGASLYVILENG